MPQKNKIIILLFLLLVALLPEIAFSAPADSASNSLNTFKTTSLNFYSNITPLAIKALWSLAMASFAWSTMQNVIKGGADIGESITLLIRLSIFPALYTLLIKKGPEWLPEFMTAAQLFGSVGTGQTIDLNPDNIFRLGLQLENVMIVSFNDVSGSGLASVITNLFPSLLLVAVCLLVLFAFGLMAAMVYIITAEAFILIALAPILFAFGGSQWTKDMAMKPWNSMIGVMLKLIILYVILSIAISVTPEWARLAGTWSLTDWSPLFTVVWQALVFAYLTVKIPQIAQNALTGSASLSAGDALQMATAAAVAAVGAAAMGGSAFDKARTGFGGGGKDDSLSKATSFPMSRGIPDLGNGKPQSSNIPSMYEPLDHSKGPLNLAAENGKINKSGNASNASIGGSDKSDNKNKDNERKPNVFDHTKGALETFSRAVPNDHVSAGGDIKSGDN